MHSRMLSLCQPCAAKGGQQWRELSEQSSLVTVSAECRLASVLSD